ncbi:MAG TPA: glycosyltransferase family 2 protein [Candidatus Nanoarchaeia archaeon]|nr:glycosyltransferase family 2 protein [Candidatus Nanoarchaeia archaeon]
MKPSVAILIVHKDGEKILDNCLKSLETTLYNNYGIHLLLNGTKDKSKKIAEKYDCKVYTSEKNLGFARGTNYLLENVDTEYVVLLNNDVEVDKNWLSELITLAEEKEASVVQPKILSLREPDKFEYAGAAGGYIDTYGYPFCRGRLFSTIETDKDQYNSPVQLFWASGACMLIKRDILKKVGQLDKLFYMYGEEIDLCWRINLIGGTVWYAPQSKIYHIGSYTIKKTNFSKTKEYLIHRNTLLMFLKNTQSSTIAKRIVPRILLELISAIFFPTKLLPSIRALIWILKHKKIIESRRKEIEKIRKKSDKQLENLIHKRSVALDYFLLNRKTFKQLWKK